MVCPNCNSTDIITVQGQRFCISCGQLLPEEMPVVTKVITSSAPAAKTRKPGRPKAGRLDTPKPEVVPVKPAPPAEARLGPAQHRQRLSDLIPVAPPQPPPAKAALQGKDDAIVKASLRERFRPAALVWMLVPAALLAAMAGAVTLVLVGDRRDQALAITWQAGWPLWGELVLVFLLFYLSRSLGSAAVMFGTARRADHRPASAAHQLGAAVNSFGSRVGLDIVTTVLQTGLVALGAGLVVVGGTPWPVPEVVQLAGLFIAYLALVYVFVGLGVVQGLGHAAVTLGKLTIWQALSLSWSYFRHHFELVGFRFVSLLLELVLALPLFAAVAALIVYLPPDLKWGAVVAAVSLTLVGGALLGVGVAAWWVMAYRSLVRRHPGDTVRLLAGRQPQHTHRGAAALVIVLTLALATFAAAWPWLSLHTWGW